MNPTALLATSNTGAAWVFWVCAIFAVCGALGMLISRKPVHSALWVAFTMINLAVLYVALSAPFLGMIQIIVYTGAIMMLFVFVIMIVGVDASDSIVETLKGQRWIAILFALGLGGLLIGAIVNGLQGASEPSLAAANAADGGNVQGIARLIFTRYVVAFEVTSALLITAALGAVILTHRERYKARKTQEDLSVERFRDRYPAGEHPGNLPAAGTYARSNSVDTPALLPDGSAAPDSIPAPLVERGSVRTIDIQHLDEVHNLAQGDTVIDDDNDQALTPSGPADAAHTDESTDGES